jgi:hypothetical protein
MVAIALASSFTTGSVLTLVLPLGILIAVTIWYVIIWQRDES